MVNDGDREVTGDSEPAGNGKQDKELLKGNMQIFRM